MPKVNVAANGECLSKSDPLVRTGLLTDAEIYDGDRRHPLVLFSKNEGETQGREYAAHLERVIAEAFRLGKESR